MVGQVIAGKDGFGSSDTIALQRYLDRENKLPDDIVCCYREGEPNFQFVHTYDGSPFDADGTRWLSVEHYYQTKKMELLQEKLSFGSYEYEAVESLITDLKRAGEVNTSMDAFHKVRHTSYADNIAEGNLNALFGQKCKDKLITDKDKNKIMRDANRYKYTQNPTLRKQLFQIYANNLTLVETSNNDTYWGIAYDSGSAHHQPQKNMLGKIAGDIAIELSAQYPQEWENAKNTPVKPTVATLNATANSKGNIASAASTNINYIELFDSACPDIRWLKNSNTQQRIYTDSAGTCTHTLENTGSNSFSYSLSNPTESNLRTMLNNIKAAAEQQQKTDPSYRITIKIGDGFDALSSDLLNSLLGESNYAKTLINDAKYTRQIPAAESNSRPSLSSVPRPRPAPSKSGAGAGAETEADAPAAAPDTPSSFSPS